MCCYLVIVTKRLAAIATIVVVVVVNDAVTVATKFSAVGRAISVTLDRYCCPDLST